MRIFRFDPWQRNGSVPEEAYARADLIAVLAVVAVMGTLHFAALGNHSINADTAVCLSNFKRLIRGWQLYADDNGGRLARAYHGSFTTPPDPGWIGGWLTWDISTHNTNTLFLIDDRWSLLGAYVGRDASVFHCPADRFTSQQQRVRGWAHRARNVSGNIGIGGVNTDTGPLDPIYKSIQTVSDFIFPSPAETGFIWRNIRTALMTRHSSIHTVIRGLTSLVLFMTARRRFHLQMAMRRYIAGRTLFQSRGSRSSGSRFISLQFLARVTWMSTG